MKFLKLVPLFIVVAAISLIFPFPFDHIFSAIAGFYLASKFIP